MIFPGLEKLFDLFQAELPAGVFAEDRADDTDPDRRSISSSSIRTKMSLVADAYANLYNIWLDKFITTATLDGLREWEKQLFKEAQDSSQPIEIRRQNLLAKIRSNGGISRAVIRGIVSGILTPAGLAFDIVTLTGPDGAWIFEVSALDVNTFLVDADPLIGQTLVSPLDCAGNYIAAGLTLAQYTAIQNTAYTYAVRIYGTADAATLALLDKQLTLFEPARSTHIILNTFTGPVPDGIDGGAFTTPFYYTYFDGGAFTLPSASYSLIDGGTF